MEMESYFANEKNSPDFYSILKREMEKMIVRRPDRGVDGYDADFDPKFHVLKRLVEEIDKGSSFEEAYTKLVDIEKHAIITRLENAAHFGEIDHDIVDAMREELYGTDPEDTNSVNDLKQEELDRELYNKYKR